VYNPESRLTPEQAAKVRGISLSKENKDRMTGDGAPYEKYGRTVRYRYGTLLDWMAEHTRRSTSDEGRTPISKARLSTSETARKVELEHKRDATASA
jgi:hypothetical protein